MYADREDVRVSRWALSFVVPLVLLPSGTSGQAEILHSASGSLVNTGKKLLLLTCEHVWSKFANYCAAHPQAAIGVGRGKTSVGCIITDIPVIERLETLDLAILDFTEHNVFKGTEQFFAEVCSGPPIRPAVGDKVALTGFPGTAKRPIDGGANIQLNAATIIAPVSATNDRHFTLADEKQVRRMWVRSDLVPSYSVFFGGMSGGPAFVLRNGTYELAGLLRGGPATKPGELFFISHADFVTAEGKIDWPMIPFARARASRAVAAWRCFGKPTTWTGFGRVGSSQIILRATAELVRARLYKENTPAGLKHPSAHCGSIV